MKLINSNSHGMAGLISPIDLFSSENPKTWTRDKSFWHCAYVWICKGRLSSIVRVIWPSRAIWIEYHKCRKKRKRRENSNHLIFKGVNLCQHLPLSSSSFFCSFQFYHQSYSFFNITNKNVKSIAIENGNDHCHLKRNTVQT